MVELVGGPGRLDVAAEEPNELIGLILRAFGDALVVVACLTLLSLRELSAKFAMEAVETSGEVSSSRDVGLDGLVLGEARLSTSASSCGYRCNSGNCCRASSAEVLSSLCCDDLRHPFEP